MKTAFLLIGFVSAFGTGASLAQSSGDASAAAFGAAAVISAGMPAAVAGIQSSSDKQIAGINAGAQMYMTDVVAKNSVALAKIAQQTSMYQTYMQVMATGLSEAAATTRLGMQLNTLEKISSLTMNLKEMQFAAELSLQQASVALQERMLGAQIASSQAQQLLALTRDGLSLGNTPGDSGSALAVTTTGVATGTPQSGDGAGVGASSVTEVMSVASSESPSGKLLNSLSVSNPAKSRTTSEPLAFASGSASLLGDGAAVKAGRSFGAEPRAIRTINAYGGAGASGGSTAAVTEPATNAAVALPYEILQ